MKIFRIDSTIIKRQLAIVAAIIVMITVFSIMSPHFLTLRNFNRILSNLPVLGLVTIGMSLVMMSGGIDISAEAVLGVAAIIVGQALLAGWPGWFVALLGPLVGGTLGLLNGLVISYGNVLPIVATLGAMYVWRAVIFIIVGGSWISGIPHTFDLISKTDFLGLPTPFYFLLLFIIAFSLIFRKTSFGWHLLSIGNNEESARLAGVNTTKIKLIAYVLMGVLVGIAAFLYVGRYRNVEMTVAMGLSLEAIAATVIGGTSILGGEGTILGCLLGVFFVRLIQNGLVLMRIPSIWDNLALGALIVLALSFDIFFIEGGE
ncbi:ABC transporter permease [Candidatus Bipolaricaulota bacterium]|nr:ABC transporter permease [Candidatus Bipolaricaulota bacterium]